MPFLLMAAAFPFLFVGKSIILLRYGMWYFGRIQLFFLKPWLPVSCLNADTAKEHPGSILVCNHQSFLDLYLFAAQTQKNLCFVTKSWPYRKLFFFAPAMRRAGYVDAEALDVADFERLCVQRLKEGATLVFFPEGSRTHTGELGSFHAGAFRVACLADRPVIPMVIANSFAIFSRKARSFTPDTVRITLLSPVYPATFAKEPLPHRAMMRAVRGMFSTVLDQPKDSAL